MPVKRNSIHAIKDKIDEGTKSYTFHIFRKSFDLLLHWICLNNGCNYTSVYLEDVGGLWNELDLQERI